MCWHRQLFVNIVTQLTAVTLRLYNSINAGNNSDIRVTTSSSVLVSSTAGPVRYCSPMPLCHNTLTGSRLSPFISFKCISSECYTHPWRSLLQTQRSKKVANIHLAYNLGQITVLKVEMHKPLFVKLNQFCGCIGLYLTLFLQ